MPQESNITAFGVFSNKVKDCLDYGPAFYDKCEGKPVITDLLVMRTSNQSRELADALGVDSTKPETHYLKGYQVKARTKQLRAMARELGEFDDEVEQLLTLADNGFNFFFRP